MLETIAEEKVKPTITNPFATITTCLLTFLSLSVHLINLQLPKFN